MKKLVTILGLAYASLHIQPARALADGDHTMAPAKSGGLSGGTYIFLLFFVLTIVLAVLAIVKKPKKNKSGLLRWGWMLALAGLALTGVLNATGVTEREGKITVDHIHGMGYTQDGQRLLVAAHDGLRVYSGGKWSKGAGEANDYMGFSMTDMGFYGSGHPAPGSKLKNPLGLVHSMDEGASLHMLDFYGEIDFHAVTAGYRSHAVYVWNPQPQAKLKEAGVYGTVDDGKTWTKSKLAGISGELGVLAAHPDKPEVLALGTSTGLYLSKDSGGTVEPLFTGKQITSIAYGPDGSLYAGTYSSGKAGLVRFAPGDAQPAEIGAFPQLGGNDAIAYIAVNPANGKEWAAASYNLALYTSSDEGATWREIMEQGKAK